MGKWRWAVLGKWSKTIMNTKEIIKYASHLQPVELVKLIKEMVAAQADIMLDHEVADILWHVEHDEDGDK